MAVASTESRRCEGYFGTQEGCRQSGPDEIICGAFGASNPPCNATDAPEVGTYLDGYGQRVQQATWTSPMTNRLLLEAGFGTYFSQWGGTPHPGSPFYNMISVQEQCTAGCAINGGIQNLRYRSANVYRHNFQGTLGWRASGSYVTGAHSMKFGYQGGHLMDDQYTYNNPDFVTYRVNNGIPNQITETINQFDQQQRVRYAAFYAQEQWTMGRMTLQGALRFDRAWSYFPAVTVGPVRFLPTAVDYPETKGVDSYKDITPRVGMAYDLFGNGKTSLKVNAGKYLQAAQNGLTYGTLRPTGRLSTTVTRTWTDADRDFAPDCDLLNPLAQSPATTGSVDTCAQISTLNFGKNVFTETLDPELINGWGVRPGDWQIGVSIQREVIARVSVEVGYNRRWLTDFTTTDNLAQAPTNFGTFSVTAPDDPRLPAESRGRVISGLYNVNQNVASNTDNLVTRTAKYGRYDTKSHGILLNVSARPRNGLVFQGGLSTGETRRGLLRGQSAGPRAHQYYSGPGE